MMNPKFIERLKQQHAFEQWRDRNALEENLFVWKFFLTGNELPQWTLQRIQRLEAPPPSASESTETEANEELRTTEPPAGVVRSLWQRPPDQAEALRSTQEINLRTFPEGTGEDFWPYPNWRPPSIQSLWRMPEGHPNALLSVNTFECPSRATAHEFLLLLIAEFQLPLITHRDDLDIGDVAFSGPQDSMVLFARANLVYFVRNADREVVSVFPIAQQLDRDLSTKPSDIQLDRAPRAAAKRKAESPPESIEAKVGESVALDVAFLVSPLGVVPTAARSFSTEKIEEPATERQLMYKIFSGPKCDIYEQSGRLMCRAKSAGQEGINIYVIDANRNATGTSLRLIASK